MTNGVRLFELQDFAGAIVEFEAAYGAVPKANPLINQALCYRSLKKYPLAVAKLELALAKHEESMSADDKEAAKRAITEMRALFAFVTITVKPAGASVTIDGDPIAEGALAAPVALSPGEHEISATKAGFLPASSRLSVVSGDQKTVELQLEAAKGTLRIVATNKDSVIEIDGKPMSPGSWQGDLQAGPHTVRAVGETGLGTIQIEAGKETIIELSKGLGPLPPLPPDAVKKVEPEDKTGFYGHVNGGVLVPFRHPNVFTDPAVSSGGYVGVRAGYRVHEYAAFEGMLEYGNVEGPANGAGERTYSLSSIRIGPSLRLMSPGDLVHFVGTIGGGIAVHLMGYEDKIPQEDGFLCTNNEDKCKSNGVDFYVQTEVGVEVDFDHVLIGLAAAFYVSGTKGMEDDPFENIDDDKVPETTVAKPYDNEPLPMFGPRLYIGYAFW